MIKAGMWMRQRWAVGDGAGMAVVCFRERGGHPSRADLPRRAGGRREECARRAGQPAAESGSATQTVLRAAARQPRTADLAPVAWMMSSPRARERKIDRQTDIQRQRERERRRDRLIID